MKAESSTSCHPSATFFATSIDVNHTGNRHFFSTIAVERGTHMPILLIVVLVLLFGGGGGYYYGRGAGWGTPHYGGGLLSLVLIILLILWLTGNLAGPMMR
jgi:hypothetical protein